MQRYLVSVAICIACLSAGCVSSTSFTKPTSPVAAPSPGNRVAPGIAFRDVASEAGITYTWKLPDKPTGNILDLIGNGCAFLDYDSDGNLDILLIGSKLALYKGDGKGHFADVTDQTGLGALKGQFLGCATGDFNRDGFADLYVTAYRGGNLLENQGGKRFTDITPSSGIVRQPWATSAAFADLDGDGNLDLFIGNYVKFGSDTKPQLCVQRGLQTACSPRQYPPEPCFLYRGNGRGGFKDITQSAGFASLAGKSLGVAIADYDGSGRLSVSVANDEMPGDLMKNRGNGKFENIARLAGTATDAEGNMHGGMGTDWGDVDSDGRLDLLVGTYQNETKNIYRNDGDDLFVDKALALGLSPASPSVTFGARFVDLDNDGTLDIVLANGHVQDNIEKIDARTTFRQSTLFFRGVEGQKFENITDSLDKSVTGPIMGRGLAAGDYDNDGKIDLLIVDSAGAPLLLHNESPNTGHFVGIALRQTGKKTMQGATLRLKVAGREMIRHCHTDGSYMSASDPRVIFGIGSATKADSLTITWPDGTKDTFTDLPIDRYMTLPPAG